MLLGSTALHDDDRGSSHAEQQNNMTTLGVRTQEKKGAFVILL
jgi:hypothetical protein